MTRDALIVIAGSKAKGREFVYWTEVKDIPNTDLATIERLWQQFSGGKFGYSVQKVSFQYARQNNLPSVKCQKPSNKCINYIQFRRKNGDRARETLSFGARRLAGLPKMEI